MLYAEVAINIPLDDNFYYLIPEDLNVKRLQRVLVNFSGRQETGFVIQVHTQDEICEKIKDINIKPVLEIIDEDPIINESTLEIASWMSNYYFSTFGETLFAITPSAKRWKKYRHSFQYTGHLAHLNDEQNSALQEIESGLGKNKTFLIQGITGSGKTEIYKHLVKKMLSLGKSSIILIPEISLTPQTLERFYQTFGEEVSIYHSKLTQNEKLGEWLRALHGEAKVVIGPRSAVFMPVINLGLIIIDEEHETSYKSNNSPRYHARQVAYHRAKKNKADLILGSATPQLESYYYARNNVFHLIELKKRYGGSKLPSVEIADLKNEENKNFITEKFLKKIIETVNQKKQVLIFLNRRGFSPVLICRDCGHTFLCPNCNLSLTYHKSIRKITCHHCGHAESIPDICPNCGSSNLKELGSGTEKIESILSSQFPAYRIDRMDLDTTKKRDSYLTILQKVKRKEVDILIGTQMVAKGHDIAGIQFVGVILPDIMLNIPDFRSVERTFVLLTQVIGRAGRRDIRGEAMIQTYLPDHYAITLAAEQNYLAFYQREIEVRKAFLYPPFVRLGRIVFRSTNIDKLKAFVEETKIWLKKNPANKKLIIFGPISCPLEKLKNNYRYHIIIKSQDINEISKFIQLIKTFFKKLPYSRFLYMEIDIDPLSIV